MKSLMPVLLLAACTVGHRTGGSTHAGQGGAGAGGEAGSAGGGGAAGGDRCVEGETGAGGWPEGKEVWVDGVCRSQEPPPWPWCPPTYAEAKQVPDYAQQGLCGGSCGCWDVLYFPWNPFEAWWCAYDLVSGELTGATRCVDVNQYCEYRSFCITYRDAPPHKRGGPCRFGRLDRGDPELCGGKKAGGGGAGGTGTGGTGAGGDGGTAGAGGAGALPMMGSEEVGGGGIPGHYWGWGLAIYADGKTMTSSAPAILDILQPQPGPRPPVRFDACASEIGDLCLGHSFTVSVELNVPEGVHPLQRRYFVGNPHELDNNLISTVGVSEDGEHWLAAGSGTVTLYREGTERFSGKLSVELVDDDSRPVRHFEATFGGGWYIDCFVSEDPPREGSWVQATLDHPFCRQFKEWL